MEAQEIKRAVKIHDYIEKLERLTSLPLKSSPVFLGLPSQKRTLQIPERTKPCYEYVEQLYEGVSDHDCLFKALRTGWGYINQDCKVVPSTKERYFQQLNNSHTFHIAKKRGYLVPDCFLEKKQFCYGQYEAYYAMHEIFRSNALRVKSSQANEPFNVASANSQRRLDSVDSDNFMHSYIKWYKNVKLITTQFIVPSSSDKSSIPYILDQLWVFSQNTNQVRLIGLEIAGEHQVLSGGKSKTLGKNQYLKELGYEMYQVASWWCRVDPYRVICEFLNASGIFPDATKYLVGSELKSIDEYTCGICHAPMVRWDWDWIQECKVDNSTVLAHKNCVNHRKVIT